MFTPKITLKSYFDNAGGPAQLARPVRLAGVDVGNVTGVRIVSDKPLTPVEIMMKVTTKYRSALRKDSVTSLSTAGVLGETYIDIDSSHSQSTRGQRRRHPGLPAKRPTFRTSCAPARALCKTWTPC